MRVRLIRRVRQRLHGDKIRHGNGSSASNNRSCGPAAAVVVPVRPPHPQCPLSLHNLAVKVDDCVWDWDSTASRHNPTAASDSNALAEPVPQIARQ